MKKKSMLLLALAVVLVLVSSVSPALAYFTTYAAAKGGYKIELGDSTIDEDFYDWTKRVTVSTTEDAQPVYVRARAYTGSQYTLYYSGINWNQGSDGWFYYSEIVYGGGVTEELLVRIAGVPEDKINDPDFNVTVVYETMPIVDGNGNVYSDWTQVDWNRKWEEEN